MKKILIAFMLIGFMGQAQNNARVDKDYKNAWTLRGQTTLNCENVQVALFDKDGIFIDKFLMNLDFGTFDYTADPRRFRGIEKGSWTYKIKCI